MNKIFPKAIQGTSPCNSFKKNKTNENIFPNFAFEIINIEISSLFCI